MPPKKNSDEDKIEKGRSARRRSARENRGKPPTYLKEFETELSSASHKAELQKDKAEMSSENLNLDEGEGTDSASLENMVSKLSAQMETQMGNIQKGLTDQIQGQIEEQIGTFQKSLAEQLKAIQNSLLKQIEGKTSNDTTASSSTDTSQTENKLYEARRKLHELPTFGGKAEEWPMFISMYEESTKTFGYTDLENTFRLQKCLKGEARETVESLLIRPDNVKQVISQLEFRFGSQERLIKSQIAKAKEIAPVSDSRLDLLIPFATKIQNLVTFLENGKSIHHLLNPTLLEEVVNKLPMTKRMEWAQQAVKISPYPTIKDFSIWLNEIAKLVSYVTDTTSFIPAPSYRRQFGTTPAPISTSRSKNVSLHTTEPKPINIAVCSFCKNSHLITDCSDFCKLNEAERWKTAKTNRLCFSCLKPGHNSFNCKKKRICGINDCRRKHHYLLHEDISSCSQPKPEVLKPQPNTGQTQPVLSLCSDKPVNKSQSVLFKVIPVTLYGPRKRINTYALLDEGSSVTMLDKKVADEIGATGKVESLTLQWFGNKTITEASQLVSLQISGIRGRCSKFSLNNVHTVRDMCLPVQSLNISELHTKYHHLKGLPIGNYTEVKPKILIGLDNCQVGLPSKTVSCLPEGPVVTKTKLGWVVYGPIQKSKDSAVNKGVFLLQTSESNEKLHKQCNEIQRLVEDYFAIENFGVASPITPLESKDDTQARRIMERTSRRKDNRFETGLLWKSENINLPDSLPMAIHRLEGIERKMKRDLIFAAHYKKNIEEYLSKGYARKLKQEEIAKVGPRTWYLPHFGVKNPNKPDKIRLVFDAAATSDGISLNSMLLKGPDQNQPLIKILFKFRQGAIAVCGDIKEMFHQINIIKPDQHSQRFLWRDGDTAKPIETYAMRAMTFGATCSPCSAQYIKNRNAQEFEKQAPAAVRAIIENHYVDDYVASFDSEAEAVDITTKVRDIHLVGGFELRNFVSNSKYVLNTLNGQDTPMSPVINMNVEGQSEGEKILGMYWDTQNDEFTFILKFHRIASDILTHKRRPSKREMLSLAMSIFDPFGLLANYTIGSKILLQEVWKTGIDWDEALPDTIYEKWIQWQEGLEQVKLFKICRCYSPRMWNSSNVQLHIFTDASESAFAAVAYFRILTPNGVDVSFVAGKTKCAPKKLLSIPRLELQSAVLGTRLKNAIVESHDVVISQCIFWSDSKTVISWIRSDHRRYKPFVGHRISEILETTHESDWNWIPTKLNVADEATRATSPPKFDTHSRWLRGPDFLKEQSEFWPKPKEDVNSDECAAELRLKYSHIFHIERVNDEIPELNRFSDYFKVKRVTAWVMRFVKNCQLKSGQSNSMKGELTVKEIDLAELHLCRKAQLQTYPMEFSSLVERKVVDKSSPIFNLTPYVDEDQIIRVQGRIDAATSISFSQKRPIILPKNHKLTRMIVDFYHRRLHHHNQELIIAEIRHKFWIPHLRVCIKRAKNECQKCKIDAAKPQVPIMGQLPPDRLTPYVRPFSYTGLDYFGPFYVTIGRRQEKRWIALFTCLTIRAVHLEMAADMSTDSCILCIRNFINRRGVPIRIRSDNGTNFVGADKELRNVADFLDNNKTRSELAIFGIEWLFNCPANPSEGGCWERLVRSIKRVLYYTLKERSPKPETLTSLIIEAENIVNSRPLTHLPISTEEEEPLTPNHFLLGTSNSTQTPGPIDEKMFCLRKQWRIAQQLKNQFWKRWIREYLPTLTRRTKWFERTEPLKVGDLVIICDTDQPRSQWRQGRIIQVFKGKDDQIRTAEIKTTTGVLRRPASKLAVLDVVRSESGAIHGGRSVAE